MNLVTVCGHNTTMLKHMLNYYKDIVDDIFVVAYLHNKNDGVLEEIKKIVYDIGSDIYNKIVLETFNWEKVTSLYNETMSVIGVNMLQDLQKAGEPLPNAEQLQAIIKDLYGNTAAYKAVANNPDQLRIAAEAAISKHVLLEDIKKSAGEDVFGDHLQI